MHVVPGFGIVTCGADRGRAPERCRQHIAITTQRHEGTDQHDRSVFQRADALRNRARSRLLGVGRAARQGAAIPEQDGEPLLRPTAIGTLAVAVALLGGACMVAARAGWLGPNAYPGTISFAVVAFALIFAVRAVGDFRYVGFFKRIRGSRFARMDTLYYSPLCAALALSIASMFWPW